MRGLERGIGLFLVVAAIGGFTVGLWQMGTSSVAIAENQRAASALPSTFLPILFQNYLAPIRDDFSNPNSGWTIRRGSPGTGTYVNGEYLIQVSAPQSEIRAGNNLNLPRVGDLEVQVNARSDTPSNASYGLYFALNGSGAHYTFNVNPGTGQYALYRWDLTLSPPTVTIIPNTSNPVILTGTGTNVLGVMRSGPTISLYANGHPLQSVVDATLGTGTVGMEVTSSLGTPSEAYFDNFAFLPTATQTFPLVARSSGQGGPSLAQDGALGTSTVAGTGVGR